MAIKATIRPGSSKVITSLVNVSAIPAGKGTTFNSPNLTGVITGNATFSYTPTFNGGIIISSDSNCPTRKTQVNIRGNSLLGQYSSPAGSTADTIRGDVFSLHGPSLNNFYGHHRVSDTPVKSGANIELFGALPSNATRLTSTRKAFYDARAHTFRDSDANPNMFIIDSG